MWYSCFWGNFTYTYEFSLKNSAGGQTKNVRIFYLRNIFVYMFPSAFFSLFWKQNKFSEVNFFAANFEYSLVFCFANIDKHTFVERPVQECVRWDAWTLDSSWSAIPRLCFSSVDFRSDFISRFLLITFLGIVCFGNRQFSFDFSAARFGWKLSAQFNFYTSDFLEYYSF